MDPETLRTECPAFEEGCYLNTGASGPSPRRVVEAADEFQRHHQYHAPREEGMYTAAFDELAQTREAVAGLLGTDADHVALTQSTVEGINHVAGALDFQPGDTVVRTDLEHPAGVLPWQRLRDLEGIEIRELPTDRGRLSLDTVKDAVDGARLVCLSSIAWNYGTRLPVAEVVEIAHDAGAQVLVDAVQSPGQMPMAVEEWGADFVAASGHKWLLGVWGAGFLYVADPERHEPRHIGYFSVEFDDSDGNGGGTDGEDSDRAYRFRPNARRFELGTTAVAPHVALATAIESMESIGLGHVEARIERLTDRLKAGLGDRLLSPEGSRSGLVTFAADDPDALVERLADEGIQIRSIPDPHACRASVHAVNTEGDIDRLLDAL
jgi:selenocysteine lyase/cysteine desulfurase